MPTPPLPPAAAHNLPEWLYQKLLAQYGPETEALCVALQRQAPVDLRANALKTDRASLQSRLRQQGIEAETVEDLPYALTLSESQPLQRLSLFQEGHFEIQDRASQAVCHAVSHLSPSLVLDYCAGGGGKSLALAAQFHHPAHILATDADPARLAALPERATRAGATHIQVLPLTADFAQQWQGKIDLLVLDVPCSGTGTLRRHPDLAWRFAPQHLDHYTALQMRILNDASALVKKTGNLLYITCSLLQEENQNLLSQWLRTHPNFRVVRSPKIWKMGNAADDLYVQFAPHRHQSDGIFMALLQCGA